MSYENNDKITPQLQKIIPELKKQLEVTIKSQRSEIFRKNKIQMTSSMKQKYTKILQNKVETIQNEIKQKIKPLQDHLIEYKNYIKQISTKKQLSHQQQNVIIEQTVDEIINDETIVEQLKNQRLPKIIYQVKAMLDKDLEEVLEEAKRQFMEKIKNESSDWYRERTQHWKKQSQMQLEQLAEEYKQLQSRKCLILESLRVKKTEKNQIKCKYNILLSENQQIYTLKKDIQSLRITARTS